MKFALLNTTCSQLDVHVQLFTLVSGPKRMINTKKVCRILSENKRLPKGWQWSINVCSFFQAFSFSTWAFLPSLNTVNSVKQEKFATLSCDSPLRTSKINQIQPPKTEVCHWITFPTALNYTCKDTMRAAALAIHICCSHFPVCNPLEKYFRNFIEVSYQLTITTPRYSDPKDGQ